VSAVQWNSLADTIEAARAQGRREGRNQVLAIVRRVMPTTEADYIESRVIEATTPGSLPKVARSGSQDPLGSDPATAAALNSVREDEQPG